MGVQDHQVGPSGVGEGVVMFTAPHASKLVQVEYQGNKIPAHTTAKVAVTGREERKPRGGRRVGGLTAGAASG
jgi:hypothetical protein